MATNGNFNSWLQNLQLKFASADSCKNCNPIATGKKTQVAIFATRKFAVQTRATKSVDSLIYAMKPEYFRLYFHSLIMQLQS